jgi:hypothetical protein
MPQSVDNSQSLSPATNLSAPWAYEQNNHGGRDAWAWQNGLSLTKADPAMAPAEHPSCQQQIPVLNPWYGTIPWVIKQLPGSRLITLDCFHQGKSNVLFLILSFLPFTFYRFTFT